MKIRARMTVGGAATVGAPVKDTGWGEEGRG